MVGIEFWDARDICTAFIDTCKIEHLLRHLLQKQVTCLFNRIVRMITCSRLMSFTDCYAGDKSLEEADHRPESRIEEARLLRVHVAGRFLSLTTSFALKAYS